MLKFYWTTELDSVDRDRWTHFLESSHTGHYQQSLAWAQIFAQRYPPSYFWAEDDEQVVSIALIQTAVTSLPLRTIARCARGPVCDDIRLFPRVLTELAGACAEAGAMRLEINPNWTRPHGDAVEELARDAGFVGYTGPARGATLVVDLQRPLEEIVSSFRKSTRYEITKFFRNGGEIKQATQLGELESFLELFEATEYHSLYEIGRQDAQSIWKNLLCGDRSALLLLAFQEGRLTSGILVGKVGKVAWYVWGASVKQAGQGSGSHALQWEAIRRAKSAGCTTYDLGGWRRPEDSTADLYGVPLFKKGFSDQVIDFIRPHRKVLKPATYALWRGMSEFRNRLSPAAIATRS